jgi:hypothetical protein
MPAALPVSPEKLDDVTGKGLNGRASESSQSRIDFRSHTLEIR